ncbi:MAG: hypothetical protein C4527_20370 [Candidatus Omnitrophota bacterium]|jgi:serine phosphatase RsbU (regulator of sigma subunit)|nr:MAG: hypothetical protein C4527_20370 [Candidatus Omnitrophota bacterium]
MAKKLPQQQADAKEIHKILNLKNRELASLLDEELLDQMVADSRIVQFNARDLLVKQHDPSDSLYLILEGRCTVTVNDKVLSHIEAGDLIGEMGVIQNTPRSATIIAIEPTLALRIPGVVYKEMLKNPKLSTWTLNLLTERLKRCSYDAVRVMKEMEEMVQDQMELARIQRSLLPKELPSDPRALIHVLYSPCAYAGGDYYDAIMLDENRLFLIVADVTGHGAQASISMAIVRSFVHQPNFGKTPASILKRLNRYLFEYGPSQHFVTAQVAVIDLKQKKIHVAYAGHPPALILRGKECESLVAPRAFFLRFRLDVEYKSATMSVKSGDRIMFYTDGVVESSNPSGGMFNVKGLQDFMTEMHKKPVNALPGLLEARLHQFREGNPEEDDITFMVVEIR